MNKLQRDIGRLKINASSSNFETERSTKVMKHQKTDGKIV